MNYSKTKKVCGFAIVCIFITLMMLPGIGFAQGRKPVKPKSPQAQPAPQAGMRLIDFGGGDRRWMTVREIEQVSLSLHGSGRCGTFMDITHRRPRPAVPYRPYFNWLGYHFYSGKEPKHMQMVQPLFQALSPERIRLIVEKLSSFKNRHFRSQDGVQAAHWIRDEFARIAANRSDVRITMIKHSFAQPSVMVTLPGVGPHAREQVVLGGHEDSTAWGGSAGRAPGADDNASGIATVLEIFRIIIESGLRMDRTIHFMAFAGEEGGLLGSQDIAENFEKNKEPVVGVMQLDMTLYPGKTQSITLINDYVDEPLTQFTGKLIDTYVKARWGTSSCGYGCSDHASWSRAGFASTFPFEAPLNSDNPNIHTERDTIDKLDILFGLHFVKLGLAFAIESAND